MPAPLDPEVKIAREIERLKMDNSKLRASNKLLARSSGMTVERVVEEFQEFLSGESAMSYVPSSYPLPRPAVLSPMLFGKQHNEIATLVLSDWHLSEYIRAQDTNGLNCYSSPVCANRLWHVVDAFKRIVLAHQAMYQIDEIWLPVLGDMISGDIHRELALTNDLLPIPASVLAGHLLIAAVLELKTLGKLIRLDCIVGNHGRTMETMPTKQQSSMSYDWMVYVMAQNYFANDPQVLVKVHTGQFGLVDRFGFRFAVEHGYGVKQEDALEARLRAIFDNALYRQATGLTGTSVDFVVIGDRHREKVGSGYLVNGALSGAGELGMSWRLSPIPSVQQAFGISRTHPLTWHYPITCQHINDGKSTNRMSEFANEFMKEHGRNLHSN